jgi:hypothetical protein
LLVRLYFELKTEISYDFSNALSEVAAIRQTAEAIDANLLNHKKVSDKGRSGNSDDFKQLTNVVYVKRLKDICGDIII